VSTQDFDKAFQPFFFSSYPGLLILPLWAVTEEIQGRDVVISDGNTDIINEEIGQAIINIEDTIFSFFIFFDHDIARADVFQMYTPSSAVSIEELIFCHLLPAVSQLAMRPESIEDFHFVIGNRPSPAVLYNVTEVLKKNFLVPTETK